MTDISLEAGAVNAHKPDGLKRVGLDCSFFTMGICMKGAAIVFVCLLPQFALSGEVFKCADESGNTVFSQRPCGADAKQVTVTPAYQPHDTPIKPKKSDGSGPDIDARIEILRIDRKMANKKRELKNMEESMNKLNAQASDLINYYSTGKVQDVVAAQGEALRKREWADSIKSQIEAKKGEIEALEKERNHLANPDVSADK